MKTLIALPFVLALVLVAFAQNEWPTPSKTSQQYHEYRQVATEPSFGLSKVKSLIKKLKADNEDNMRMSAKQFNALSFEDRFTYVMIHGEDSTQNCDAMPPIMDEQKKIFGYFPGVFNDEMTWSDQQRNFLKKYRGQVMVLLRKTISVKNRVGVNLKTAVCEINAIDLIPDLIKVYNRDHKDHDILTVLMILMSENKYPPFLASVSWKKLYGPDANYQGYLDANAANQRLILDRALAFYKSTTRRPKMN